MAEQEVIKHIKNIYTTLNSKEHSVWKKLIESVLEIAIIVFAISLSIWFHNQSEHAHEQKDVKLFLLGLKSDLTNDIAEMQGDMESYRMQMKAFQYIAGIRLGEALKRDSIIKYGNYIFNTTSLDPNNGRFEGFKSAGKLGEIENMELQNDILDLYQEDMASLLVSTSSYVQLKTRLFDYVNQHQKHLTDSTTNITAVLAQDEAQNICAALSSPNQVIERYGNSMKKAQKIIAEINKEYELPK